MKYFVFSLLLLSCSFYCAAQDYQVYNVKGNVTVQRGQNQEPVNQGAFLSPTSILTIAEGARIVVLNEAKKELHTIKTPGSGTLSSFIISGNAPTQQLTESYLAFIKQKITDSGAPKDKNYKQSAGTSYRETDSLLMKAIVTDQSQKSKH